MQKNQSKNKYAPPMRSEKKIGNTTFIVNSFFPQKGNQTIISKLEKRLAEVTSVTAMLDEGCTPEMILDRLLGDMDLVINDTVPTEFYCNCSKERVSRALISVGRKDLNEMIQDGKPVELNCHFCNTNYVFTVEEMKELLRRSR